MATFRQLLGEMTTPQARTVLGLSNDYSTDDVKKAYRQKAKENHPDVGGSEEAMKDVNLAYELLQNTVGKVSTRTNWDEIGKKYSALRDQINDIIKKSFDTNAFIKYFETFFGQPFKVELITYYGEGEKNPAFAGVKARFVSDDDMITLMLNASVYLTNISGNTSLGGSTELSIPLSVSGVGFFNARKFKLFDSAWGNTMASINLNKPEEFFPEAKLKKHSTKKDRTKATRKDYVTAVLTVLKGKPMSDKDSYMCEIGEDTYLGISRSTFMRVGMWRFLMYNKVGAHRYIPVKGDSHWSFLEEPELLDVMLSLKGKDISAITKELNDYKVKVERKDNK